MTFTLFLFLGIFLGITLPSLNALYTGTGLSYNTQFVASGQVKLTPTQCQQHAVTSFNIDNALRNCHGARDSRTEEQCIKICGLRTAGVIVGGGHISESGVDAFVQDNFPYWTWHRISYGMKACSGILVEDTDDMTCVRSKPYLDCFENAAEAVCRESPPVVLPPHPHQIRAQQMAMAAAPQGCSGLLCGLFGGK